MKKITFKYRDTYSDWLWKIQVCIVPSVEECKSIYGLSIDCEFEIISVEDLSTLVALSWYYYRFYRHLYTIKEETTMENEIKLLPLNTENTTEVSSDNNCAKTEISKSNKGETTMKNATNNTTILPTNNPFANTLAREAEEKAAQAKAEAEAKAIEEAQKALEESEKQYDSVPDYDLVAATQAMSKTGAPKEIKIAGVIIGYASNEADAEALRVDLHHYGKNLITPEAVLKAVMLRDSIDKKASILLEAGFVPERSLEIDGITYLVNAHHAYTMEGHMVADLSDCGNIELPQAIQDELYTKRIKETLEKECPCQDEDYDDSYDEYDDEEDYEEDDEEDEDDDSIIHILIERNVSNNLSLHSVVIAALTVNRDELFYDDSHSCSWSNCKDITATQLTNFASRIVDRLVDHSPIEANSKSALVNKIADLVYVACERDESVGMRSPAVGKEIAKCVAKAIVENSNIR